MGWVRPILCCFTQGMPEHEKGPGATFEALRSGPGSGEVKGWEGKGWEGKVYR